MLANLYFFTKSINQYIKITCCRIPMRQHAHFFACRTTSQEFYWPASVFYRVAKNTWPVKFLKPVATKGDDRPCRRDYFFVCYSSSSHIKKIVKMLFFPTSKITHFYIFRSKTEKYPVAFPHPHTPPKNVKKRAKNRVKKSAKKRVKKGRKSDKIEQANNWIFYYRLLPNFHFFRFSGIGEVKNVPLFYGKSPLEGP